MDCCAELRLRAPSCAYAHRGEPRAFLDEKQRGKTCPNAQMLVKWLTAPQWMERVGCGGNG